MLSAVQKMQFPAAVTLAALGIALPAVWFLVPIGLTLFFLTLLRSVPNLCGALWRGAIFGAIVSGAGVLWLLEAFPIGWVGIDSPSAQLSIVVAVWLYVVLGLAPAVAVGSAVIWKLRERLLFPLYAAAVWVLVEQGQMWGFSILTWAPESLFGPHFSFASLGYALAENEFLLQAAHPFGIAGLSFVLALSSAAAARGLATRTTSGRIVPTICVLVALSMAAIPSFESATRPGTALGGIEVALITSTIPIGAQPSAYQDRVRTLIEQAFQTEVLPDVVVLPEGLGVPYAYPNLEERKEELDLLTGGKETVFIYSGRDGATDVSGPGRLVHVDQDLELLGTYQKMFLMPLGEYVPITWQPLFSHLSERGLDSSYERKIEDKIRPGTTLGPVRVGGASFGSLLCSDMASPVLYKILTEKGANVLVNSANQNWFHESRLLYWKNLQIARVHAVQNRAYFIASNNGSPSYAIAPDGAIIAASRWEPEVLRVSLP